MGWGPARGRRRDLLRRPGRPRLDPQGPRRVRPRRRAAIGARRFGGRPAMNLLRFLLRASRGTVALLAVLAGVISGRRRRRPDRPDPGASCPVRSPVAVADGLAAFAGLCLLAAAHAGRRPGGDHPPGAGVGRATRAPPLPQDPRAAAGAVRGDRPGRPAGDPDRGRRHRRRCADRHPAAVHQRADRGRLHGLHRLALADGAGLRARRRGPGDRRVYQAVAGRGIRRLRAARTVRTPWSATSAR